MSRLTNDAFAAGTATLVAERDREVHPRQVPSVRHRDDVLDIGNNRHVTDRAETRGETP